MQAAADLQANSKALQILVIVVLPGDEEGPQSRDSVWLGERFLHLQLSPVRSWLLTHISEATQISHMMTHSVCVANTQHNQG